MRYLLPFFLAVAVVGPSVAFSGTVGFAKIRMEKTGGCYETIQYPSVVNTDDFKTSIRIESLVDICVDESSEDKEPIDFIAGYNIKTISTVMRRVNVRFAVAGSRESCRNLLNNELETINTTFDIDVGSGRIKRFVLSTGSKQILAYKGGDFCYTIVE